MPLIPRNKFHPVNLKDLLHLYQNWVSSNPKSTTEIESAVKWVSYYLTSRYNNSNVLSELIFTLSNLMVLFNDRIIFKSYRNNATNDRYENQLKMVLTVLEHCEVFIEISAEKLWGNVGKWFIVFCIQLFKSGSRLKLLFIHKEPMIENPAIPSLKRKDVVTLYEESQNNQISSKGYVLKSGKIIRSLNDGTVVDNRTWKPLEPRELNPFLDQPLNQLQVIAETMYIVKPLVHLGGVYYFGKKSWKPWLLALSLDLTSLYLMKKKGSNLFSKRQRVEMVRRHTSLLMYLMRSPFYDRYSKNKIREMLNKLSNNISLIKFIIEPINEYIPHWQQIYFYTWSS